ncbi:hypothetical protein B4Q13_21265 [Lacticaseibacillus rhamnosus]
MWLHHSPRYRDCRRNRGQRLRTEQKGLCRRTRNSPAEATVVLIHDGVRPLINEKVISDNIASVHAHGSAITTTQAIETIVLKAQEHAIGEAKVDGNLVRPRRCPGPGRWGRMTAGPGRRRRGRRPSVRSPHPARRRPSQPPGAPPRGCPCGSTAGSPSSAPRR